MICFVIILTVSFWIVKKIVRMFNKEQVNQLVIYVWGALLLLTAPMIPDNYIFSIPIISTQIILVSLVVLIINLIISGQSGYHPVGWRNIIYFSILYPIFEEVAFRGMILPLLNPLFEKGNFELAYLPLNGAVVITAFLFAIAHLQYYRLNAQSIRFMVFAFIGGLVFGAIANETKSIVIPVILHIAFNLSAAIRAMIKDRT